MNSTESNLLKFADTLAKKYEEKKPATKHVVIISLPDDSFQVESLIGMLDGNMMDPATKAPTPLYQEIALLLKLGTECMAIYRDEKDNLLIIYFKRLKNESLDSSGHQFSIVQIGLDHLKDKKSDETPIKLKLLLKDISLYISKDDLIKRLSYRGQNRHYFILKPETFGSLGKKSIAFRTAERHYELNYEDWTMDRFGTYGSANSVVHTTIPPLSYCLLFDFDFHRSILAPMAHMGFHERFEQILQTNKGESIVVDSFSTSKFVDYLEVHKTYYRVMECIILRMRQEGSIIKLNSNHNYLLFDVDLLEMYMREHQNSPGIVIEEWFRFGLLANKAVFYTAINKQYRITNILDLPPSLPARLGCPKSTKRLIGLLAYHSQAEYTELIKNLLVPDSLAPQVVCHNS